MSKNKTKTKIVASYATIPNVVTTTIPTEAITSPVNSTTTPVAVKKRVNRTPAIPTLSKTNAAKLVKVNGGRIFNVTFMEKNKSKAKGAPEFTERNMTCRLGVKKYTKAVQEAKAAGLPTPKLEKITEKDKDLAAIGMMTVYELTGNKGYKTLPLGRITALKINKGVYKVK